MVIIRILLPNIECMYRPGHQILHSTIDNIIVLCLAQLNCFQL